jgi:hypothetical protein
MNINPVSSLLSTFQMSNVTPSTSSLANISADAQAIDATTVSPAATLLNKLAQLQQQNPAKFSQVLTAITSRIQQAAQSAAKSGNSAQAAQLSQLAATFQGVASTGQLPSVQQLQQAGFTGHGHHQANPVNMNQAQTILPVSSTPAS